MVGAAGGEGEEGARDSPGIFPRAKTGYMPAAFAGEPRRDASIYSQ